MPRGVRVDSGGQGDRADHAVPTYRLTHAAPSPGMRRGLGPRHPSSRSLDDLDDGTRPAGVGMSRRVEGRGPFAGESTFAAPGEGPIAGDWSFGRPKSGTVAPRDQAEGCQGPRSDGVEPLTPRPPPPRLVSGGHVVPPWRGRAAPASRRSRTASTDAEHPTRTSRVMEGKRRYPVEEPRSAERGSHAALDCRCDSSRSGSVRNRLLLAPTRTRLWGKVRGRMTIVAAVATFPEVRPGRWSLESPKLMNRSGRRPDGRRRTRSPGRARARPRPAAS